MVKNENDASPKEVDKFRKLARDAVKHLFGSYPKRIVHRASGLTNFVFSFSNADGEFVIRISPDASKINSFIKERWAEHRVREAGVPTPRILEVGHELIQFPYMISRSVSGTEATHHPKRFDILREMGRYAAKINSIRTKGFGETFDWSQNKLSFRSTFKDYLENEYRFEDKLDVLTRNKMISESTTKKLRRTFSSAAKSGAKPVLNHGDLRLKNVIADENGKINAVLDWGGCVSTAAPAWELSIALHDLGIDSMQYFLEGYGSSEKKLRSAMPLVRAFNITNYAGTIGKLAAEKDKKLLAQYALRLSGALDLYSLDSGLR